MGLLNRRLLVAPFVLFAAAMPVAAQDSLQKIRDLYASAAYEDTLSAITSVSVADPKPEVEQYRVFSLVALGRLAEAEQAVEAVLTAHPRYRPDATEASPRIQELFTKVRRRIAPEAVKTLYRDGKAALDRKDREAAIALFDEMLLTADDADVKEQPSVADLRLLGVGFLELSRALPMNGASRLPTGTAAGEAGTPAAPPAAGAPVSVTGPVAIRQDLPPWQSSGTSRVEFSGTIRVMISAAGTVESAEMVASVHPTYDSLLVNAARKWLYQPARRNGVPMPSEKTVTVRLTPSK